MTLVGCGSSASRSAGYAPPSYPNQTYATQSYGESYHGGAQVYGGAPTYAPAAVTVAASTDVAKDESYSEEVVVQGSVSKEPASPPSNPVPQPTSTTPGVTNGGGGQVQSDTPAHEMLDIQANVIIGVDSVDDSVKQLRLFAHQYGANVINDSVTASGTSSTQAVFQVRVPSEKVEAFLDAVSGLGNVRARNVIATDVSKQYFDDQILLHNLEVTMKRYEEMLSQAKNVQEMLVIENELTRLRGEINRVKGEMRFMRDRVARSTVNITLLPKSVDTGPPPPEEPQAKFYPGLRGTYLSDLRGDDGHQGYVGLGLSLHFARAFQIDMDLLRKPGNGFISSGLDAFLVTLGGDTYSDFFGGGRRKFLNPYLGLRAGYSRIEGVNDAVVGLVLGVELVRTKGFLIDMQGRALIMFGGSERAHVGMQPSIGINMAF
jgi:hypothetical protein